MLKKVWLVTWIGYLLGSLPMTGYTQTINDVIGQTIQIHAEVDFSDVATWLIIVRDLDNGINIPYIFDLMPGVNNFVAPTFGRHYKIKSSRLTVIRYKPSCNTYRKFIINDFCHLQGGGRIHRYRSMSVILNGHLPGGYRCQVYNYASTYFIVK